MAGEQAAGYCSNCNRAVTIRKKSGPGLFRKVSSMISGTTAEGQWECTKCGGPASKSFAPPPQPTAAPSRNAEPQRFAAPAFDDPLQDVPPLSGPSEYRPCPHCQGSIRREAFKCVHCQREVPPLPKLAEATCHICGNLLKYDGAEAGQTRACPTCTGVVALPAPVEDRAPKTTPPPVVKFPDDPARPTLTLAMCAACEHHLTYQKKHAGRKMNCPKCGKMLVLP